MPTGDRKDPYAAFRFRVEIDGISAGGFSEVSGLQAETETEDYREGGNNRFTHKLPKLTKYPNLTLKRGLVDSDLFGWHQEVVAGTITRKTVSVVLMDETPAVKWRWTFSNAYPVKWAGPDLKADSNTVAVETLELVHKGFIKG